jgi:alkaline phosphatase
MRRIPAAASVILISIIASPSHAQTVYPIDRADILTGARFDFKVEFAGLVDPARVSITLNGEDSPRCSARPRPSSSARTARTSRR